jgi:3-hydroxy-9,10-secoandrosta-1,3,5(10)-triene-9,17-dione monooxygenase reductase component
VRRPLPAGAAAVAEIDPHRLRHALGRFVTGVAIVTTLDADGAPVGLTVNSFNSLSLEPPLVLWSLRRNSGHLTAFSAAPRFAVSVLTEAQIDLSRQFAARGRHEFDSRWLRDDAGLPLLAGAAATFVCETTARQTAGDHRLFIGRVLSLSDSHERPLLFHAGRYRRLGDAMP